MTIPPILTLVLLIILTLTGCTPDPLAVRTLPGTPTVRVRLLERQSKVVLSSTVAPLMQLGEGSLARELRLPKRTSIPLLLTASGWQVGGTVLGGAGATLTLIPVPQGTLSINGKSYRGRYRLVPVSADEFDVVNDLDLDSYLKGVIAREMLPKWDMEAYKAQAIVARTYALYEAKTAPSDSHYDLNDDTRSQVYGGISSETDKSREAVDSTAGIVAAYGPRGQEKIFKAYFSACCGGIGQSAETLGDSEIPPLSPRSVGALCAASPRFNNPDLTLSKAELTRRFKIWGVRHDHALQDMAALSRIDVLTTNTYGRPARFVITDVRGTRYALRSEELRNAINAGNPSSGTTVYSSFFTPVNRTASISFTNQHGHGHGVGLCQYCAQALALRGTRHEDIVVFSYPQSKLVRAY